MATYQQINGGAGHGCGPACLMVAEHERNGGLTPLTAAEEIVVHTACAFPPYNPGRDSSPVLLADYARNTYGFPNAKIVLSGQLFKRMLLAQHPGEMNLAGQLGVPVEHWVGWSPRFLPTAQWVIMVVVCVDYTPWRTLSPLGMVGTAVTLGAGPAVYDLARGLGIGGGGGNVSLHNVLYRGSTYMDPATGTEYWFLGRMGGPNRTYWDTGCYVVLS